jgi:hypothetical protein
LSRADAVDTVRGAESAPEWVRIVFDGCVEGWITGTQTEVSVLLGGTKPGAAKRDDGWGQIFTIRELGVGRELALNGIAFREDANDQE